MDAPGVGEVYPTAIWRRLHPGLADKTTGHGRTARASILMKLGVAGLPESPTADQLDACVSAWLAACACGAIPGVTVEAVGEPVFWDEASQCLREGVILVPVVSAALRDRAQGATSGDAPSNFAGTRLAYYGRKCEQHLRRVRLSHLLALGALDSKQEQHVEVRELEQIAFESESREERRFKMRRGLHEVHLSALKADFELFMNRLLTVLWTEHLERLAGTIPKVEPVSVKEVADVALGNRTASELVIQRLVPKFGLQQLRQRMESTTGLRLHAVCGVENWSQIHIAFEVRHLIEHSDAKVDDRFVSNVASSWPLSSWGSRSTTLPPVSERITVEEQDVQRTFAAMIDAAQRLTAAVVVWSLAD